MEINEKNKPCSLRETLHLIFPDKTERHQNSKPP
jgi:hypothetical protein